jgi:multicomponent Na+:H+ antiporter subunit E
MRVVFIAIGLALLWAAMSGSFAGVNLLFGLVLAVIAVALLRSAYAPPRALKKLRQFLSLFWLFLVELMKSAIKVASVVLSPDMKSKLEPAIIAYPLSVTSDAEITLLANLITLTPGTLSLDISQDRKTLYVHALQLGAREAMIADIANGFETKVRELYS